MGHELGGFRHDQSLEEGENGFILVEDVDVEYVDPILCCERNEADFGAVKEGVKPDLFLLCPVFLDGFERLKRIHVPETWGILGFGGVALALEG